MSDPIRDDGLFQIHEDIKSNILDSALLSDPANRRILSVATDSNEIILRKNDGTVVVYRAQDSISLGKVALLDGSLTFATNFPLSSVLGSQAVFPASFWKTGRIAEINGGISADGTANISVHLNESEEEQYIQAINLQLPDKFSAEYRSLLICTAVNSGIATIKHVFFTNQSGFEPVHSYAPLSQGVDVSQPSAFYLRASGASGVTVNHSGAIARCWN